MEGYTQVGAMIAIILAVCEAIKRAGMKGKYVPVLAVVLGLAGAYFFDGVNFLATGAGVIAGLTAVGSFEFTKNLVKKDNY